MSQLLIVNVGVNKFGRIILFKYIVLLCFCTCCGNLLGVTSMLQPIRIGLQLLPDLELDTSNISNIWKYYLIDQMTEQLLYVQNDDYYSGIAKKWEVSKDQKRYVFYLDKDAKFSDGTPITSKEVGQTFKRLILKTGLHWKISKYLLESEKLKSIDGDIKGIEIIDTHTIALNLTEPYITMMYILSMTESGILSSKQIGKDLSIVTWKVSSGAYSGLYKDKKWVLSLNPHRISFKRKRPMFKTAEFIQVSTSKEAIKLFSETKLDIFIPGPDYSKDTLKLISSSKLNVQNTYGAYATTEYLYLNISKPPFNNLQLRQSIYKSWLGEKFEKNVFSKLTEKAEQLFLPTSPGRLSSEEMTTQFKSIKKHSNNEKIKIVFLIPPVFSEPPFYLDKIKTILESHNFDVEFSVITPDEGFKRITANEFDIVIMDLSMTATEMNTALSFLFSKKRLTIHDINNDIMPLIQKASQVIDRNDEAKLNKKIAIKLMMNAEIIPTLYVKMPYFYREGLDLTAIDKYDNDFHLWEIKTK